MNNIPIAPHLFGKVAVLMGGHTEREVSLKSGSLVLQALQKQGIDCIAIDYQDGPTLIDTLRHSKIDRVFNVLHGGDGENGVIQSLLQLLKLPYTDSPPTASALGMHKQASKLLFEKAGIRTPAFHLYQCDDSKDDLIKRFGLPLVIKPMDGGSSLGVTILREASNWDAAIRLAKTYSSHILIEPYIDGYDVTVGIVDKQALPIIRIVPDVEFYDYQAKYISNNTRYECPADIDPVTSQQIQTTALQAFDCLGCQHWGRADFRLDSNNVPWLLEVNTVPGMTDHSLVPIAAKQIGLSYEALIVKILALTLSTVSEESPRAHVENA
jgi:D-alanine-D-alanine ligase